jgi:hypothetical protein
VSTTGNDQRLGHDQQGADLDVPELAIGPEPVHELHHAGHVDGDELRDMRRGERRADHGLCGHLAHALDRDAHLALAFGCEHGWHVCRGTCAAARPRIREVVIRCIRLEVGSGDDATDAGAGDLREVEAQVLGELAHRRLRQSFSATS